MGIKFKLEEGEKLNRNPNKPILAVVDDYIWIGNNAEDDMACFAILSGKKVMLKLADAIYKTFKKKRNI